MVPAHRELAPQGVPLASGNVQISLLHRKIESSGVLEAARRLGITLIAYVPLRSGVLTGELPTDRTMVAQLPSQRCLLTGMSTKSRGRTIPLADELGTIADAHRATVGQVALGWLITSYDDTAAARPDASKPHHADEAAGAMKVARSDAETRRLADRSTQATR